MSDVLVIAANDNSRQEIEHLLAREALVLQFANDTEAGLEALYAHRPQLVIVDFPVAWPRGADLCRLIRQSGIPTSIIVMSCAPDVSESVLLLEQGADDVIVRPFHDREFQARVRANIRRSMQNVLMQTLRFGDVEIDFERRWVSRAGKRVEITPREYNLLVYFIRNSEKLLTRDTVLNEVWGYDAYPITRTVDAHVARLRSKLEPNPRNPRYILTMHRVGYRFVMPREQDDAGRHGQTTEALAAM